ATRIGRSSGWCQRAHSTPSTSPLATRPIRRFKVTNRPLAVVAERNVPIPYPSNRGSSHRCTLAASPIASSHVWCSDRSVVIFGLNILRKQDVFHGALDQILILASFSFVNAVFLDGAHAHLKDNDLPTQTGFSARVPCQLFCNPRICGPT